MDCITCGTQVQSSNGVGLTVTQLVNGGIQELLAFLRNHNVRVLGSSDLGHSPTIAIEARTNQELETIEGLLSRHGLSFVVRLVRERGVNIVCRFHFAQEIEKLEARTTSPGKGISLY
jgi:hypothetical protein